LAETCVTFFHNLFDTLAFVLNFSLPRSEQVK
jgi:hypothetical protein